MSYRLQVNNSDQIGCFMTLTNTYCLVTEGADTQWLSKILNFEIPVIQCQVDNGNTMVGTMTCGNSKGLLVPHTTTDYELEHIKRKLPKDIKVERINDVFTALGNCIACNDSVALIHPEMSEDTEKIIAETL